MRRSLLALSVVVGLLGFSVAAYAHGYDHGGRFTDDNGNTHEGAIEAIAQEGITKGCNPPANSLYCPKDVVSRGAMAAFLTRAFDLVDSDGKDWFKDDDGHLFEADINRLAAAGITKGCNPPANDMFCPDQLVSRGAMAAFLVRAFGYEEGGGSNLFEDDDGHLFENDIDRLGTAGVTKGCNPPANDEYCPNAPVDRDAMASFLARALKLPQTPPPTVDTFGAGTYTVHGFGIGGDGIEEGIYRNIGFNDGCYWERLSGFSGESEDVIVNEFTNVGQIVQVFEGEGFRATSRCGTWTNQLVTPRFGTPSSPFVPGTYLVGNEITPGTWASTPVPGDSCYWERLSGFSGEFEDIIANDFTDSASIVEIKPDDAGFLSDDGCGTWTRIG
jgi:hypothetical protein